MGLHAGHQNQVTLALRGSDGQHPVGGPPDPSDSVAIELDDRSLLGEVEERLRVNLTDGRTVQALDKPLDCRGGRAGGVEEAAEGHDQNGSVQPRGQQVVSGPPQLVHGDRFADGVPKLGTRSGSLRQTV